MRPSYWQIKILQVLGGFDPQVPDRFEMRVLGGFGPQVPDRFEMRVLGGFGPQVPDSFDLKIMGLLLSPDKKRLRLRTIRFNSEEFQFKRVSKSKIE